VCHVPGPRGISLDCFFAPAGHRLNVFLRCRAPADLGIACPLSCYCYLLLKYGSSGCNVRVRADRGSNAHRTRSVLTTLQPLVDPIMQCWGCANTNKQRPMNTRMLIRSRSGTYEVELRFDCSVSCYISVFVCSSSALRLKIKL